jgi:hypothetical protein
VAHLGPGSAILFLDVICVPACGNVFNRKTQTADRGLPREALGNEFGGGNEFRSPMLLCCMVRGEVYLYKRTCWLTVKRSGAGTTVLPNCTGPSLTSSSRYSVVAFKFLATLLITFVLS